MTQEVKELLADDYTARHITGYEQPKAEWLAQIGDGHFERRAGSWVATHSSSSTY